MTLRVLLVPGPPPDGVIENGQDRYLDSLVKGMAGCVRYAYLEDPQYARGPDKKWEPGVAATVSKPRNRFVAILPGAIRLLLGYARDVWRLARILRPYRHQADIIHVNRVGCEVQPIAARLAGFKNIVTTIHNLPGDHSPGMVERWVERLSFFCGTRHIAVAEATFDAWHSRIGLARKKTVTIYNGMDPDSLDGFDRRAYRAQFCTDPEHTFIIGICARLHRMKGHAILLEAVKQLLEGTAEGGGRGEREEGGGRKAEGGGRKAEGGSQQVSYSSSLTPHPSSFLLLIAGEGPERGRIEAKIAELGLGEHVRMLGHWDDPTGFAAAIDLNVLPSIEQETIGYQNIEAMFAGVPSVVSDYGGMKEIVGQSGGGRVVPAGDRNALADVLLYYINNPDAARHDGAAAQAYARANLTAEIMAHKTARVYEQMMENGRHAAVRGEREEREERDET